MGVFGDRLRREREMRGITLDEITESTKIARRHLEALEGEHFDQLPGGVFNKGFVRAYARFLGIDEDQAVADYSATANEQPEPEDKFPLEIHEEPNRELNPRRSRLPLAFAIAAVAGVLVGYFFWVKAKPHGQEPAPSGVTQTTTTASSSEATPAKPPTSATTPAAEQTPVAASPVRPPKQTQPVQQLADQSARKPAEKTFVILIRAREDAWVSIIADGKSVMQRVMTANKNKLVKAGKQVVLRTGNAGGIDVLFNGRPLGQIGNENEPRTLTFNAAGLVQ